ncbi:MAG: amino acid permease [Saprospiraceae bacterium]|nr:amino acid permease [Saprospiraceae bacterium]
MKNLFKVKPFDHLHAEAADSSKGLKRTLSATNLVSLGIGAIIGTGIFVLTGTAAAEHAGPALVLAFILSGIGCAFAGLCYAEYASMIPISGSAYAYSYSTLGEFIAWIIGWDLILEYLFGASTVAVGWSGYFVSILKDFGVYLPPELIASTGTKLVNIPNEGWQTLNSSVSDKLAAASIDPASLESATALFNFPAVFIIGLLTVLLVIGIKESANFNNIIVLIKLAVIILFIIFGFNYIQSENWVPFIPERIIDVDGRGHYGWFGIVTAAGVIFFAYIGFDAVSTLAQEAKNPQKDMPIGILGSLVVCTILYILVALVMTGIVNYKELNVPAPIALAIDKTGESLEWLRFPIKIGAIAGLSSVILVMLMGQPRIFFSMAKDGLLPPVFAKVHSKYKTPHVTTILTGVVAAFFAGILPINILGELVSIGTLFAFVIVCIGIIVLRKNKPDLPRPFKTPWVPAVPILGALICFAQMLGLPMDTWLRLIVWMVLGISIYFFYGIKHSKVQNG